LQYFSKKKLVLPEGYFVNSSQIPLAKEVNKLLANCGCETFPTKPLSEAIQKSNFFFTIQNELRNKLYGFVRVTSDRGLNANLWNLSAAKGSNQKLFYSILLQVTLEKINTFNVFGININFLVKTNLYVFVNIFIRVCISMNPKNMKDI